MNTDYDQGWKDGYKHGAWANTAAPVQEPFDTHNLPGKSLDTHSRTTAAQRPVAEPHKEVTHESYGTTTIQVFEAYPM